MKLVNNMLMATVLVTTSEVVAMVAKSGRGPQVMIDVRNADSGATSAGRDKLARAIPPRTFDYGYVGGLIVRDDGRYLGEASALGPSGSGLPPANNENDIVAEEEHYFHDSRSNVAPISNDG